MDDFKSRHIADPETQQQGGNKSNKNPFQNAEGMSHCFQMIVEKIIIKIAKIP